MASVFTLRVSASISIGSYIGAMLGIVAKLPIIVFLVFGGAFTGIFLVFLLFASVIWLVSGCGDFIVVHSCGFG